MPEVTGILLAGDRTFFIVDPSCFKVLLKPQKEVFERICNKFCVYSLTFMFSAII